MSFTQRETNYSIASAAASPQNDGVRRSPTRTGHSVQIPRPIFFVGRKMHERGVICHPSPIPVWHCHQPSGAIRVPIDQRNKALLFRLTQNEFGMSTSCFSFTRGERAGGIESFELITPDFSRPPAVDFSRSFPGIFAGMSWITQNLSDLFQIRPPSDSSDNPLSDESSPCGTRFIRDSLKKKLS
jgi:hypothetical protein